MSFHYARPTESGWFQVVRKSDMGEEVVINFLKRARLADCLATEENLRRAANPVQHKAEGSL